MGCKEESVRRPAVRAGCRDCCYEFCTWTASCRSSATEEGTATGGIRGVSVWNWEL